MDGTAIVAANGQLSRPYGKTAHGLIRGSSRYQVVGVIDANEAGRDAGTVVDGRCRNIPVYASVTDALQSLSERPRYYILGFAAPGGQLPAAYRAEIELAIRNGLSVVSGMHEFISEDHVFSELANRHDVELIDVRKHQGAGRFWSGEILSASTPRIAVLGMDCGIGKRTTAKLLAEACNRKGIRTALVATGQTGWMQGVKHGFILDSVLNDFVCGELEHAILQALSEEQPHLVVVEGQSSLRHPAGPCGSELIISGRCDAVILQHAPGREYFEGYQALGCRIPPVSEEIQLIQLLGAKVLALTLNGERLSQEALLRERTRLQDALGLPVLLPLNDQEIQSLADVVAAHIEQGAVA